MTYLDFIFIGIIVFSSVAGAIKGLITTVFGFLSTVIALIFAYVFYHFLSGLLIESTKLFSFFQEKIADALDLNALSQSVVSNIDRKEMIQGIEVPGFLKTLLIENDNSEIYNALGINANNQAGDYVSSFLATIAINVMAFIILFIIGLIIIGILTNILDLIAKLPVLKQVNHVGGLILGFITGVIMLWVLSLGLYLIVSMQGGGDLQALIDKSTVVLIFYDNNLLLNFLTNVTQSIFR
ncbi:MAG: CvpA family protein [Vallitaleaceae bacterium]|jgi:uncharacterized membrane protein required for colicin V production|nr:CvpA family protein [Vallitaleaceae bacterium]